MKLKLPDKILKILRREYPEAVPLMAIVGLLRPPHSRAGIQSTLSYLLGCGWVERPSYGLYRWKKPE